MATNTRRTLYGLSALVFICMFNLTFIVPSVKELIMDRFDASVSEASLFVSVEMLAYILFAMVWGAISDKRGERRVFIALGFLGSAILYYTMTLAPDLVTLLALRFTQGALTVMSWSLIMTIVLDTVDRRDYGASMGIVGTGLALGLGFGAPVGGALGDVDPLLPLYAASVMFVLATAMSLVIVKDLPIVHKTESIVRAMRLAVSNRRVVAPYLFAFAERFSAGFLVLLFPIFLADEFGASPQERGLYLAAFLLPFALLQYPFGRLSDVRGRRKMLIFGGMAYAGLFATLGLLDIDLIPVFMAGCGALAAMLLPVSMALIGTAASRGERATFMGGFNSMGSVGFALGPILAALFSEEFGYRWAFLLGGVVVCISVIASVPFLPRTSDGSDDETGRAGTSD